MKRVTLTLIAMVCAFAITNAQLKPEAGDMGLGFRITGLANVSFNAFQNTALSGADIEDMLGGTMTVDALVPQQMLFGRYYLASDLALRVGLGINSATMKTEGWDSAGGGAVTNYDNKESAFSFGLNVGVEKHFASAASRLDPYAGAEINIAMLGTITGESNSTTNSDPAVATAETWEYGGGFAFGVGVLAGFNYFFSDNFALGAEMSWGFMSASTGGDWTYSNTSTVGGTTTTMTDNGSSKMTNGGLSVGHTAGVNASIFW